MGCGQRLFKNIAKPLSRPPEGQGIAKTLVSYAERWVQSGRMRSILPATNRLNTKMELVTRRGVALTLVSETFAEFLRQVTLPTRC